MIVLTVNEFNAFDGCPAAAHEPVVKFASMAVQYQIDVEVLAPVCELKCKKSKARPFSHYASSLDLQIQRDLLGNNVH